MAPRWKGKDAEAKALADPMSKIIHELHSCLIQSKASGLLSGCSVLFAAEARETNLLNRASFGQPFATVDKDKQWLQLSFEEAFYLCYSLKCLQIEFGDGDPKSDEELWCCFKSRKETFPKFYAAYSHLRMKNWVVRSGSQYGVDYVAYRHHPALVHSEYGVLVVPDRSYNPNARLTTWSDFEGTTRLCGSVAKTLLVLFININGRSNISPSCLDGYTVEEYTMTRWNPEQCREE